MFIDNNKLNKLIIRTTQNVQKQKEEIENQLR